MKMGTEEMKEQTNNESVKGKTFYAYDYLSVDTELKKAGETADYYESIGWELIEGERKESAGKTYLNFRRDRKIKNKDQLLRLQKRMEDALESIRVLQKKKKSAPAALCAGIGIAGTLILGAGMCLCLVQPALSLMIGGGFLGAFGIAIMSVNYFIFKKVAGRKAVKINPLISKKSDEIVNICEEAHRYL